LTDSAALPVAVTATLDTPEGTVNRFAETVFPHPWVENVVVLANAEAAGNAANTKPTRSNIRRTRAPANHKPNRRA
jgi:hypothetical protein